MADSEERSGAASSGLHGLWPPVPAGGWRTAVPMGEGSLLLQWDSGLDRAHNRRIHRLAGALLADAGGKAAVVAAVPGFYSLLVEFDPDRATPD